MKTKPFVFNTILFASFLLFLQGCGAVGSDDTVVSGEVINQSNGEPVPQAIVQITSPEEHISSTTTNDEGQFSFGLNITEAAQITLQASKQGFVANTLSPFPVSSDNDVTGLTIELAQQSSGGGGEPEPGGVGGESGGPASIVLTSIQRSTIAVKGTGGEEHSAFTFTVKDSAGRVVTQRIPIEFNIIRGPGGGETINPESGFTNPESGQITANIASGDSSGTVRIEAVIERPEVGLTIRSTPVLISIASGFPEQENFNVGPRVHNFDAYGIIAESHTNPITASVGDLKGNPVKQGTAVYFSATNGGLVNGSAITNANGYATVNLSANGSTPTGHPLGIGFIDVIAQTVDKDNNYIEETSTLLLTTPAADISVSPTTLNVTNGGSQNFTVTITDLNGYPMAAGTQIAVVPGEGLAASGDIVNLTLGDYFITGPGRTEFTVTISDADPDEDLPTQGSFTISVVSPIGGALGTSTLTIGGTRAKF